MTITIELTPEQETRLRTKALLLGIPPEQYLLKVLDEPDEGAITLGDRLRQLGAIGGFESKPRPDGLPWSEVEGFE